MQFYICYMLVHFLLYPPSKFQSKILKAYPNKNVFSTGYLVVDYNVHFSSDLSFIVGQLPLPPRISRFMHVNLFKIVEILWQIKGNIWEGWILNFKRGCNHCVWVCAALV